MATSTTVVLVRYQDPFDVRERGAVAGFLAGYTGLTRVNYTTDIRLFACWCTEVGVRVVGGSSVSDVLDEERDTHECPPLVEIVTSQPDRHDVERLDVAQAAARFGQRALHGVVGTNGRPSDHLDDLYDTH